MVFLLGALGGALTLILVRVLATPLLWMLVDLCRKKHVKVVFVGHGGVNILP